MSKYNIFLFGVPRAQSIQERTALLICSTLYSVTWTPVSHT